jgi:hypothetical protein
MPVTAADSSRVEAGKLPDLGAAMAPFFQKLSVKEQRLLLARIERAAAGHYREWAAGASEADRPGFLEAARGEDGIADTLESLDPDAREIEASLRERFPEIERLYASALAGQTREDQLRIQAAGEVGAAALLRGFADAEPNPDAKRRLLACASTEESNATFLRRTLPGGHQ